MVGGGVVFMGHPVFIAYFKNCNVILKRQNSTVLYSEFRTKTLLTDINGIKTK